MNKRSRFILIIAVLGICFGFLWPTISWYGRLNEDQRKEALKSLEEIKKTSKKRAQADLDEMLDAIPEDGTAVPLGKWDFLKKPLKEKYKLNGEKMPKDIDLMTALLQFQDKNTPDEAPVELLEILESRHRKEILKHRKYYDNSVKLGLDLQGGVNVIVDADLDKVVETQRQSGVAFDEEQLKKESMEQAISSLTNSIDRFGLSSPVIRQQGESQIYIEIPGNADANEIKSMISGRGMLNFRLVDQDATQLVSEYDEDSFDKIPEDLISDEQEILGFYSTDKYGLDEFEHWMVVYKNAALEGKNIKSAEVSTKQTGEPAVNFRLDGEGAQIFGKFTTENVNKTLCIVSNGRIKSYAGIMVPITTGDVQLSGFSRTEAENIRKVLQTAWLDVPLSVGTIQTVGATMGQQAIKNGVMAIAIGLIAIMIFMLIWYKGAGVNACVAQVLNLYIMFSVLSAFNLTITLPTIAGMILTIGMAVDANVIIFERIKEERLLGKDRASSIQTGFGNALWAILDSNITTFIAAFFMSQFGTGSIQGFAYSLAIGVCSTVFTALVVSRLMFDFGTEVSKKENISIGWRVK